MRLTLCHSSSLSVSLRDITGVLRCNP
jgi:hypothetical protein